MGRVDLESGTVRTNFHYVNKIAPHSLAFFVMSSLHFVPQTKIIANCEHIVLVRETEADYAKKIFDSLEILVDRVEFLMNSLLPGEIIHHVALPDNQNDVGGFYKFNYYR
jgi:hypothetical protein